MSRLKLLLSIAALSSAPLLYGGNDDSCDISVAPAATLLLPYFEVDFTASAASARTTLFTITNTSPYPEIAHVVLWTDWSYAALNFNLWLTGYDVQSINLYDVFKRGAIAPGVGAGGTSYQPGGADDGNPNHDHSGTASDVSIACKAQPGLLSANVLADLQKIFTLGTGGTTIGSACSGKVGGVHAHAIGSITIDVANTCNTAFPGPTAAGESYSSQYLLFDNVLIGDYQDVNPDMTGGNFAAGNTMVHIRAVPEGGPAHSNPGTNLPYTFYDRFNLGGNTLGNGLLDRSSGSNRLIDRRQPLPSTFAARYIEGGQGFKTYLKLWREGVTGPTSTGCGSSKTDLVSVTANSELPLAETARFDEEGNANGLNYNACSFECPPRIFTTSATLAIRTTELHITYTTLWRNVGLVLSELRQSKCASERRIQRSISQQSDGASSLFKTEASQPELGGRFDAGRGPLLRRF